MSNVFEEIGHGIKTVAVDVAHGVEKAFTYADKVEKILSTAITDQPEIKSAIVALVKAAEPVVVDTTADVAEKGLNLVDDAKTLSDAEAFFSYFKTSFLPIVEQVYAAVVADVKS